MAMARRSGVFLRHWPAAAILTLFAATASAMQRHNSAPPWLHHGRVDRLPLTNQTPYRQTLENYRDTQYTALITVGKKKLKAMLDTGSFELYVFSTQCSVCGLRQHLFKSPSPAWNAAEPIKGVASFGSGTIYSSEVVDDVLIGPMAGHKLSFWAVTDADMEILRDGTFHAIFGLGPPSSALKFAKADAREIHQELNDFTKQGREITPEVSQIVARYDGSLAHASQTTPAVQSFQVQTMSVCFQKSSGSPGYHIWNDDAAETQSWKFMTIPVTGDSYWSAAMTSVTLGYEKTTTGASTPRMLGCRTGACSAVLDTGTTLISAPRDVVEMVYNMVDEWVKGGGTCEDLSKLPDLEFKLGDRQFSLPAESYMGRINGDLPTGARGFMPRYAKRDRKAPESGGNLGDCDPLIMELEVDSDFGPLWILGMPFFRKYYTSFHFKNDGISMPVAESMSFSVADENCEPGASPSTFETLMRVRKAGLRPAQLRVDASKIRGPRLGLSQSRVEQLLR